MKKSLLCLVLVMLMLVSVLPVASAATAPVSATVDPFSMQDDSLIYVFTEIGTDGYLEIADGYTATADILVVGGGGSGSSGCSGDYPDMTAGYGGQGGEVKTEKDVTLSAGRYNVIVGAGAESVQGSSGARRDGIDGSGSMLCEPSDSALLSAEGGAGGTSTTVSGAGTSSDITGLSVTYGKDDAVSAGASGQDGTGNGGKGGSNGAESGPGDSGKVVIKITNVMLDLSKALLSASTTPVYNGGMISPDDFGIEVYNGIDPLPSEMYDLLFYADPDCTPGTEVPVKDAGVYYVLAKGNEAYNAFNSSSPIPVKVLKAAVPKPEAVAGPIIRDGTEKVGVKLPSGADASLYTLTGDKATEAGSYSATASLKDPKNYCWAGEDGDPTNSKISQPININWEIKSSAPVTHKVTFILDGTPYMTQSVADGEFAVKPTDPEKRFARFNGWFVSKAAAGSAFDFEKTPITADLDLYSDWDEIDPVNYKVIEGANLTIYTDAGTATFRSNADYNKFLRITIDGKAIAKSAITVKSGSTIVIFSRKLIKSLKPGKHTLVIDSTDGYAETTFMIKEPLPKTGDSSPIALWSLLLVAALGTAAFVMKKQRKHN